MNNRTCPPDVGTDEELAKLKIKLNRMPYHYFKRAIDFTVSLLGYIPTTVVVGIVYLANRLTGDKGPVFFAHTRIGKDGKPFQIYKFRTMRVDAAEILEELLKDPARRREWKQFQKFENDPRVTKVGKVLRKLSLDELPQMRNILRGDMSIIGPRPLLPNELESHGGDGRLYNLLKPGLTSWWAVNGRSETMYWERLELEYEYIRNFSFKMDVLCALRTVRVVFSRKGAK